MADQRFRALSSCLVIALLVAIVTARNNGMEKDCLVPLGMEDGRIKVDQLRTSTILNDQSQAANGRLNQIDGYGGWCPNQTRSGNETGPFYDQFIEVTLDMPVRLKGIVTQGRANGEEKVERYLIAYTPDITNVQPKWILDEQTKDVKFFIGNIQNILRPPIVAEFIRIVPEISKSKQVCLRFELLGCSLKYGLVTYQMPQGNTRGGRYNFTDSGYDGLTKNHVLSAGLGMLTDGKLDPEDAHRLGWIGWNSKYTPTPYIIFEFLNERIFHFVTLHCNVRDKAKIKLFSKVVISFSMDGVSYDASLEDEPKSVSSRSSWMNYNVTIDLHRHTGKFMKLDFWYAGNWILISEVTFHQDRKKRCSCFTFENDSPMSWLDAFNSCKQGTNKHLVVMETEQEWNFITKEIQTRKRGKENEWHIGLDRGSITGKWTWINGKTVLIDKWQKDKPQDSDLFTLMANEGSFNSINRSVSRGWICEEETDSCQGICFVHNQVRIGSALLGPTTPTTVLKQRNISTVYDATTASEDMNGEDFSEDATMSVWSPFTACSASCGAGYKTRNRTCNRSRFGGKNCSALGRLFEKKPCNVHDCNGTVDNTFRLGSKAFTGTVEKEAKANKSSTSRLGSKAFTGLTRMEITIVSTVGPVFFIIAAALAARVFKNHRAGRKPNNPDVADEEQIEPYATVRLSRIFPLNAQNNDPGNYDNPLETFPFQIRTPQEETGLQNSPYENTDLLGRSSVTPVQYLIYQPRYENEAVNETLDTVVIRPGYDKLAPATRKKRRENGGAHLGQRLPCGMVDTHSLSEYDSLIRETDLGYESRKRDITDNESEDNTNIHTILKVPSSDERSLACSMDKKKSQENSLGEIESGCIEMSGSERETMV